MEPVARPHTAAVTAQLQPRPPLAIQLYAASDCQQQLRRLGYSRQCLLQALRRELQQQSRSLGRRPVPWLSWQLPLTLLDSAGITELMYFVGRCFLLGERPANHYQVVIDAASLQSDLRPQLALFKGLGFNHLALQLSPSAPLQPQTLTLADTLCQEFQLRGYSLQFRTPTAEDLANFVPDLLEVGPGGHTVIGGEHRHNPADLARYLGH